MTCGCHSAHPPPALAPRNALELLLTSRHLLAPWARAPEDAASSAASPRQSRSRAVPSRGLRERRGRGEERRRLPRRGLRPRPGPSCRGLPLPRTPKEKQGLREQARGRGMKVPGPRQGLSASMPWQDPARCPAPASTHQKGQMRASPPRAGVTWCRADTALGEPKYFRLEG